MNNNKITNQMKIVLCMLLMMSVLLTACAPEKIMNNKIDGTWNLVSINGKSLGTDTTQQLTFIPSGRGGEVNQLITESGKTTTRVGTYTVMKFESITTSFKNTSTKLGYDETVYNFTNTSKTALILTQQSGVSNVYVFEKN